jgi:Flp pilus assembly protein TadG
MSALFFLAFAYFAVGQAAVTRNGAQTAADAAALAAAREFRDGQKTAFLEDLANGDLAGLGGLLTNPDPLATGSPCEAAGAYAADNDAEVTDCHQVAGPIGYTVEVNSKSAVGSSVIDGTEDIHAVATATAVVEPRCTLGDKEPGSLVRITCPDGDLTIDPKADDLTLDLSALYSVHLSKSRTADT